MSELTDRGKIFRAAIAGFIEARREAKLKGDDEEASDSASRYDYATWLADVASRAHNLQVVTHPIKFTHSTIKGASSVHIGATKSYTHAEIGTHSSSMVEEDFAISDAKHLDVYSLLKQIVEGRRLLDWLREDDADFAAALDGDPATAAALIRSFKLVVRKNERIVSHPLAKQIYWLKGEEPSEDGDYHLLQPMFSSSLEHAVHADIRSVREATFAARGTSKQKPTFADHTTYLGLVARTFGGSNAQNVSPQNKVRGGINYLLASLPPSWNTERPRKLLNIDSAMQRLIWFEGVRDNVDRLTAFLRSDPPANDATRKTRRGIEQELGAQLTIYAAEAWARFEAGWTADENCGLPMHQKIWLDPGRVEDIARNPDDPALSDEDRTFFAEYEFGDWPDQVAGDFANWINERLRKAGLVAVGDAEHRHWARQAIIEAAWPLPVQRRAPSGGQA